MTDEARKVLQYDRLFHKMAHEFEKKMVFLDCGRTSHEDLYQSLRLAFVELMRKGKIDDKKTVIIADYRLKEAMLKCVLENCPIGISRYGFIEKRANLPLVYGLQPEETQLPVPKDSIENYPFRQWVSTLPKEERAVANAIMDGNTIAQLIQSGTVRDWKRYYKIRNNIRTSYLNDYLGKAA